MSQAKVDKYKQEKYNRKNVKKKSNIKKVSGYIVATLVVILFIGYLGYSVAVATGLYTPPATTIHRELSEAEKESIRNVMIQNGNTDVKVTTAAAKENTTTAKTEKTTKSTEKETTAKK